MNKHILPAIAITLVLASFALAQNDPGHDSLYVEQSGDSQITGSLNTSENLTVKGGELEITNQFEIRGDGSTPGSNINTIISNHDNYVSINSPGNGKIIRLQDQVANGVVQLGIKGTNLVDLNVSNDAYFFGNFLSLDSNFELRTDGTFPSTDINTIVVNQTGSSRQMWLTSNEIILAQGIANGEVFLGRGGSDSVQLNLTGNLVVQGTGTIGTGTICTTTNGLCASSGSGSGGGWTNTTTTTSTSLNVTVDSTTLHVDSTNNRVGIGTTAPGEKLHVNGSINVTSGNDICIEGGNCLSSVSGGGGGSNSAGWTNTTTTVSLNNAANNISAGVFHVDNTNSKIGIGTTSPNSTLTVQGTIETKTGGIKYPDGTTQTTADTNISVLYGGNESDATQSLPVQVTSGGAIKFAITEGEAAGWTDNGTEVYTTTSTDKVGIGTTSPATLLDVNGTATIEGSLAANGGVIVAGGALSTASLSVRSAEGLSIRGIAGSASDLSFFNKDASTIFDVPTGTTNVSFKENVFIPETSKLYLDGGSDTYIYESNSNTVKIVAGGSIAATWANAGSVQMLGVYSDTTASAANVVVNSIGDLKRSTSSLRYKKNVENITLKTAKNVVANLRSITYKGNQEGAEDRKYAGFIAEEVAVFEPLLTTYIDLDGDGIEEAPDYVTYDRVPAYLVPVVQDHESTIKKLKEENNALEERIEALEKLMS